MGLSGRSPGTIIAYASVMAVATPEGSVVVVSATDDYTVTLPSGASPTTSLLGLLYQPSHPTVADQQVEVVLDGIWPGIAGATITSGDLVTSGGTDGRVITAAPGAGVNVGVVGVALEDALVGERVAIQIRPYVRQG